MTDSKNHKLQALLELQKKNADQGDIFMSNLTLSSGKKKRHPVFILGKNKDSNDTGDVLVCVCTSAKNGRRSKYDILITLDNETYVRTNKIYTTNRSTLIYKMSDEKVTQDIKQQIKKQAISAIN